jgi:hypothetical protein
MVIDDKYLVEGICSEAGGMGVLLFVVPLSLKPKHRLILKYCREVEDEPRRRFRREVRLLPMYKGNSRGAQLWDYNGGSKSSVRAIAVLQARSRDPLFRRRDLSIAWWRRR